jgi:hypothetical protein
MAIVLEPASPPFSRTDSMSHATKIAWPTAGSMAFNTGVEQILLPARMTRA